MVERLTNDEPDPPALLYYEGRKLFDAAQWEAALNAFRGSQKLQHHFKTLQFIARCLEELKRFDEALEAMRQAFFANESHSETATFYAQMLAEAKRADEARTILKGVLKRHPTYGPARELQSKLQSR